MAELIDDEIEVLFLRGIAHYPTDLGEDYYGYHLRSSELAPAGAALALSRTVLLEHDISKGPIGVVTKAIAEERGLVVCMLVTNQTPAGAAAIKGVMNHELIGLSIGQLTDDGGVNDPLGLVEKILPFEVSICASPERHSCYIEAYAHNNGKLHVFEHYERNVMKKTQFKSFVQQQISGHNIVQSKLGDTELSSSRIQFEIPLKLQERLVHRSKKQAVKMADNTAVSQQINAAEQRVIALAKRMKFGNIEEFCQNLEATVEEEEKAALVREQQITEEFKTTCAQVAQQIGLSEKDLMGIDVNAKSICCAIAGGANSKEKERVVKETSLKASVLSMSAALEESNKNIALMEKKIAALEAKNEVLAGIKGQAPSNNLDDQSNRWTQGVQQSAKTPVIAPSAVAAPPPNTPIGNPLQRKAGLVPVPVHESIYDGSVQMAPANAAMTFSAFAKKSKGMDSKWKASTAS